MHSAFLVAVLNGMQKCGKVHLHFLSCFFSFLFLFFFFFFACLLPNEALRIKCLKDCRHFTWVVWLFKDTPQYTARWNAAQPTVRRVKSILRQRGRKKKKSYNPTLLCKWNKSLVNCELPVFIMSQRSNIKQTIVKLVFDLLWIQKSELFPDNSAIVVWYNR